MADITNTPQSNKLFSTVEHKVISLSFSPHEFFGRLWVHVQNASRPALISFQEPENDIHIAFAE